MAFDIERFIEAFPEFTDTHSYGTIQFWADVADKRLNVDRWGDLLEQGTFLFVAHNIALSKQAQDSADRGSSVLQSTGLIASKSVGGVSVSYDTSATKIENAGNFNLTRYGRDFIQLARIVGIGGLQLLKADAEL